MTVRHSYSGCTSHTHKPFGEEQLPPVPECAAVVSEAKCYGFKRKAELKGSVTSSLENLESSFKA